MSTKFSASVTRFWQFLQHQWIKSCGLSRKAALSTVHIKGESAERQLWGSYNPQVTLQREKQRWERSTAVIAGQQLNAFKPTKLELKVVKCIQDTESCIKESEKLEEPSTVLAHNPSGESRIHKAAQICTDICYSPEQDYTLSNVIVEKAPLSNFAYVLQELMVKSCTEARSPGA